MTAEGVVKGSAGRAVRRTPAPQLLPSVVDLWTLDMGEAVYTLMTRDAARRDQWRMALIADDENHTLWSCAVAKESADRAQIREITRHLARNAVRGGLTVPPRTKLQTVAWDTAVGIAMAFVERFGVYADLMEER